MEHSVRLSSGLRSQDDSVPNSERPPSLKSQHLAFLDGWRGLAVLTVLVGHFVAGAPARLAGSGVELFFVLSGRLMAEMLIVRRQPLREFFFRRASRILPALFVFATSMLIIGLAAPAFGSPRTNFTSYFATLLFFQNYLADHNVSLFFEHCWSLAVEEHSYLMLAVIAALTIRDRRTAMTIAAVLAVAALLNGWRLGDELLGEAQPAYRRTDVRSASILMSFAIFLWARHHFSQARSRLWASASPLGLAIGLAILVHPALPDPVRFSLGTFLLALSMATIDVAPAQFRRLFELRGLTLLGLISYSLYLWQQPFFHLSRLNIPVILGMGLALAGGVLSYRTIEQPVRRALNNWYTRRSSPLNQDASSAVA